MGHASFSPITQDLVCSATEPYYVTVSHERTSGHDRRDSDPQTIISGYKPSNDTRFTVDRSWEKQISSNWTKTFKFEGIFLGSVTIKHHSYYQNWRRIQWVTRTDWRYATFNIWLPSHSNVSYKKLWNPVDKTIFITYKAESAEKLDEIISKQVSIYNYEPSNIATLSGYRWEKVSEKEAKLYLDIGYNFSFVKRIIKISAGTTNLCTVVQIENKYFWKSAHRTIYAPDGTTTIYSLSIGKGGFLTIPFFIAEGKVSIIFEKDVSFLEAYPVDDFSPEEEIVPENDISLINVEVNKTAVSFTANVEEYYDYCRGAFIFTDGTNVFGRVIAVQCENAFLQGGTNPKVERTFFNINYNKDVYPVDIWQSSYYKFLKNPMFLLLGYKGYSPVFSFIFDGVKNYKTEPNGSSWWEHIPVKDTAEFTILYSDGSTKNICMRYRASAYKNSYKDIKLFATLSDSGEVEVLPTEKLEDGGDGDIIFKVGKYNPNLLFKRESGALIKVNFKKYLSDKFPRTLRNVDKSEMTKVYNPPIVFPLGGYEYEKEDVREVSVFYGLKDMQSTRVEIEIEPRFKDLGTEIVSAKAVKEYTTVRLNINSEDYYKKAVFDKNNIAVYEIFERDGKMFFALNVSQVGFCGERDVRNNFNNVTNIKHPLAKFIPYQDESSMWTVNWKEKQKGQSKEIEITSKIKINVLFYSEYPHQFSTRVVSLNGKAGSTRAVFEPSKEKTAYRVRVKTTPYNSSMKGYFFYRANNSSKEFIEEKATLIEHDDETNEWEYELWANESYITAQTFNVNVIPVFEFGNAGIKAPSSEYIYMRKPIKY